jgi:hypothetical protein
MLLVSPYWMSIGIEIHLFYMTMRKTKLVGKCNILLSIYGNISMYEK